jgi:hypothetical protein
MKLTNRQQLENFLINKRDYAKKHLKTLEDLDIAALYIVNAKLPKEEDFNYVIDNRSLIEDTINRRIHILDVLLLNKEEIKEAVEIINEMKGNKEYE